MYTTLTGFLHWFLTTTFYLNCVSSSLAISFSLSSTALRRSHRPRLIRSHSPLHYSLADLVTVSEPVSSLEAWILKETSPTLTRLSRSSLLMQVLMVLPRPFQAERSSCPMSRLVVRSLSTGPRSTTSSTHPSFKSLIIPTP